MTALRVKTFFLHIIHELILMFLEKLIKTLYLQLIAVRFLYELTYITINVKMYYLCNLGKLLVSMHLFI